MEGAPQRQFSTKTADFGVDQRKEVSKARNVFPFLPSYALFFSLAKQYSSLLQSSISFNRNLWPTLRTFVLLHGQ